jgi:hypothetical protein
MTQEREQTKEPSVPHPYTAEELAILERVARVHQVDADRLLGLVQLELGFYKMGRRRGLFPALRAVVAEETAGGTSDGGGDVPN